MALYWPPSGNSSQVRLGKLKVSSLSQSRRRINFWILTAVSSTPKSPSSRQLMPLNVFSTQWPLHLVCRINWEQSKYFDQQLNQTLIFKLDLHDIRIIGHLKFESSLDNHRLVHRLWVVKCSSAYLHIFAFYLEYDWRIYLVIHVVSEWILWPIKGSNLRVTKLQKILMKNDYLYFLCIIICSQINAPLRDN